MKTLENNYITNLIFVKQGKVFVKLIVTKRIKLC
jgi:hypothetical protein